MSKTISSEVAFNYIRKRILNGTYPAGMALVAESLSSEIGVSRTPIRDALRQLETWGLVTIYPHLGASVKTMDMDELRDTCGVRLALETYAAGLAARNHADEDLRGIRLSLEAMQRLLEEMGQRELAEADFEQWSKEDVRFHHAIISASKNEVLKREILRLHLVDRIVIGAPKSTSGSDHGELNPARRRTILKEHQHIFELIQDGDVDGTRGAMEKHIQFVIDRTLRNFSRSERAAPKSNGDEDDAIWKF